MSSDVYASAAALGLSLRASGEDQAADALEEAITSGSTGTEVLMALRLVTESVLRTGTTSQEATRLARHLLADIDRLLADA